MKREEKYIEYDERINRYLRGLMSDDERMAFEQEVDGNEDLRERLVSTSLLVQGIIEDGMNREGQYQLDTIKEMTQEEFIQATKSKKNTFFRWATGIAAIAVLALCLPVFFTTNNTEESVVACEEACDTAIEIEEPITIKQPTLASLAKEYNKGFSNEPNEFVAIREKIEQEAGKDMMAVVYDIEKIDAPNYIEGAKGAEDAEVVKETQRLYSDCTHWYKALAYLKKGEKQTAIKELNEVKEHGSNEELVNCASALLKKLKE